MPHKATPKRPGTSCRLAVGQGGTNALGEAMYEQNTLLGRIYSSSSDMDAAALTVRGLVHNAFDRRMLDAACCHLRSPGVRYRLPPERADFNDQLGYLIQHSAAGWESKRGAREDKGVTVCHERHQRDRRGQAHNRKATYHLRQYSHISVLLSVCSSDEGPGGQRRLPRSAPHTANRGSARLRH